MQVRNQDDPIPHIVPPFIMLYIESVPRGHWEWLSAVLGNPQKRRGIRCHKRVAFSRSALPMTDTELSDIASAATTGLSRMPKLG